ncbi:MAG: translation initiation factor IF-2 N-terminal domain-containing protein, partial [Alphaproteobacteria bacterium]|nr:translation initiation factor IF-2 N-terminal domain-containing protein [Alphaproteobacteria bacterium]
MTDNKDNNNNAAKGSLTLGKGRLELKKNVEGSSVRQSLSQGRSKVVQVEVRKKRMAPAEIRHGDEQMSDEQAQKLKILLEAQKETEKEAVRRAQMAAENPAGAGKDAFRAEEDEQRPDVIEAPKKYKPAERVSKRAEDEEENEVSEKKLQKKTAHAHHVQPSSVRPKAGERRGNNNRVNFRQISIDGDGETDSEFTAGPRRGRSQAAQKRAREKARAREQASMKPPEKVFREVVVPETITVGELANRMTERAPTVIKELMKLGLMATINDVIDADTAELVVAELGHKIKRVNAGDVEEGLVKEDSVENMVARAPVVTVMGHV